MMMMMMMMAAAAGVATTRVALKEEGGVCNVTFVKRRRTATHFNLPILILISKYEALKTMTFLLPFSHQLYQYH